MIFMELNDFIGKVVISNKTKQRYTLYRITSSYIDIQTEKSNELGYYPHYRLESMNSDPISDGRLIFEEASIKDFFINAYTSYCNSEAGRWEDYGYWMRKD
jgi:hypothetical protein